MAQFFAVMPLLGLRGKSAQSLHFSWCCFPTIYCFVVILLTVIYTLLTLFKTARYEVSADSIGIDLNFIQFPICNAFPFSSSNYIFCECMLCSGLLYYAGSSMANTDEKMGSSGEQATRR